MRVVALIHMACGHFTPARRVVGVGSEFLRCERGVNVAEEWAQHRDALDDDGADDFGRKPHIGVRVAPEVPFVLGVAAVFPAGADGGDDGNDHSEAHGEAEADFLHFAHVEVPRDEPWEGGHDEVHDDVVYW